MINKGIYLLQRTVKVIIKTNFTAVLKGFNDPFAVSLVLIN